MKRIVVYGVGMVILAGLVAVTLMYTSYAQKKSTEKQEKAIEQSQIDAENQRTKVKIVEIMTLPFTDYLVLPGTVAPHQEVNLAAKFGGVVKWLGPKEGDRVKKDEKLLQVDMSSTQTQMTEVRVRYAQALKDYDRAQKLFQQNIAPKNQVDNAKTQVDALKAQIDSVNVNINDGTLFSPIDGILDQRSIEVGEFLGPGNPIMKIVDIDQIDIELPIPEKDILYFKKGQKVEVRMPVTDQIECPNAVGINTSKECQFSGVIDFISMTADSGTRTYPIKVVIDNLNHLLRPGMIVRAHLVRREMTDAIAVPFFTIIDREDGKGVFVIGEDNVVHAKTIQYGAFQKGLVEIRDGLKIGEKLVIVGQRNLVDGEKVEVAMDVTALAKQWISEGKDLSQLPADILK